MVRNPFMDGDEEDGLPEIALDMFQQLQEEASKPLVPSSKLVGGEGEELPNFVLEEDAARQLQRQRKQEEEALGEAAFVGDGHGSYLEEVGLGTASSLGGGPGEGRGVDEGPWGFSPEDSFLQALLEAGGTSLGEEAEGGDADEGEPPGDEIFSRDLLAAEVDDDDEEDVYRGFVLDDVLNRGFAMGASDVHLSASVPVRFTLQKSVERQPDLMMPDNVILDRIYHDILKHVLEKVFVETLELDTSYVLSSGEFAGSRTRLNLGRSFGNAYMVFRLIDNVIRTPEELGVPLEIQEWMKQPHGVIFVNGPTGSGKSTTLASLLQEKLKQEKKKLITLEKPVEYIYDDALLRGFVTQREVGLDSRSFINGLISAMRQNPDMILVGETRDKQEMDALLYAAESGHLTFTTMHAISSAVALNKIRSMFVGEEQARILSSLSDMLRGMVNQALVPRIDGRGVFAVHELLTVDDEVRELVGRGDSRGLRRLQVEREATMEHALARAVRGGLCTRGAAEEEVSDKSLFERLMRP